MEKLKCNMERPKQGAAIFGQLSTSLNNLLPNSGRNVILTDIGHLYEYYLKKGEKYLYPFKSTYIPLFVNHGGEKRQNVLLKS